MKIIFGNFKFIFGKSFVFIYSSPLLLLLSCQNPVEPVFDGMYHGIYSVTSISGRGTPLIRRDSVDFEFSGNKYFFKCQNNLPPYFGAGTFSMTSKYIFLNDTAIHTGNVTSLNGAFNYEINEPYLILIQELNENNETYKFDLKRDF